MTTAQPPETGRRHRPGRIVAAVTAALLVVPAAALAIDEVAGDRPIIGLRADGVGWTTLWGDVDTAVDDLVDARGRTPVTLTAAGQEAHLTWAELGLTDDPATIRTALLQPGRDGDLGANLLTRLRALVGQERAALPAPHVNPDAVKEATTALADAVHVPARDAVVRLDGEAVVVVPGEDGRALDVEATARALEAADLQPGRARVAAPVKAVPAAVSAGMLEAAAATVRGALAEPLALQAGGHRVDVPTAALFAALPVEVEGGEARVVPDVGALSGQVDALVEGATTAPQPRVIMLGAVVAPGVEGTQVDRSVVVQRLGAELAARAAGRQASVVDVPVTPVPAPEEVRDAAAFAGEETVHLTFDDGPGAHTETVLDVLAEHGVHATFYLVGDRVARNAETVRRILREGHRVGNHSWSHADLTKVDATELARQLDAAQQAIKDATGVLPTAFRPPEGALNAAVREAAAARGLTVDLWTLDTKDWRNPGVDVVVDRVVSAAQPGDVVLMHVLRPESVEALPRIIEGLRKRGIQLD